MSLSFYVDRTKTWRNPVNLPVVSVNASVRVFSTASRATFTQIFRNPSKTAIDEAKYTFPLYADCAVVAFSCKIGDRSIEGVVKPKETANTMYEEAKASGQQTGLFEQISGDVFSTSIGNIPAGQEVQVVISTISELKHDSEVDGIRLTIPTTVAPRYGSPPVYLEWGPLKEEGITLKVEVDMPEHIRLISSPSHPVTTEMGGWGGEISGTSEFDPTKALATMKQTETTLTSDFILYIRTATPSSTCTPQAILETHPTIHGQQALMTTLVPRFQIPPNATGKPELIFIVDRSGSMHDKMNQLKSALRVFLKSIPLGCYFNIISFGSRHTSLWKKSKKYSGEALKEAMDHVDSMDSNYGGTEMLQPIEAAIKNRLNDINTEIILLTDGEIWGLEQLQEYIRSEREKTNMIRIFTIGVGMAVSHELVESVARLGGGYSQIVGTETGTGWENKVVRMLKAALGEHFDDCSLELEFDEDDDEDFEMIDQPTSEPPSYSENEPQVQPEKPTSPQPLSLFNAEEKPYKPDSTESHSSTSSEMFAHLAKLPPPNPLQAPYKIPGLIPFERTTVYLLLSKPTKRIKAVILKAKLASGIELSQRIPVSARESSDTIHKLAARALLRDLTDGHSWLSEPKVGGVDTKASPTRYAEYVEREGTEAAMKWGLASKWTSFVAVEDEKTSRITEMVVEQPKSTEAMPILPACHRKVSHPPPLPPSAERARITITARAYAPQHSQGGAPGGPLMPMPLMPAASDGFMECRLDASDSINRIIERGETMNLDVSTAAAASFKKSKTTNIGSGLSGLFGGPKKKMKNAKTPTQPQTPQLQQQQQQQQQLITPVQGGPSAPVPCSSPIHPATLTDEQKVLRIIDLQTFEGAFEDVNTLMQIMGLKGDVSAKAKVLGVSVKALITTLVVEYLKRKHMTSFDITELCLEKAVDFAKQDAGEKWEVVEKEAQNWVGN
ncbi:hypothetical protein EX30DRAFT_364855 [Ascodesmis nigricans]|uniref:VIT-domain-containing protein n=1 Tax=Ascodesmis nigricans TaxID=341454 RepID=A0A4S2MUB4_9PEZI|nr:hypothetical protein EX30DRAFT_364855 [Ascodesmis nigricans]